VAGAHAVAAVIKDASSQQSPRLHPVDVVIVVLLVELGLNGIEQGSIDDGGGLLALQNLAREGDFSNVEPGPCAWRR
jgi:hypothetical protein